MADPFAETTDLAARWRPLSTAEQATATALLSDASAIIRAECPGIDSRIESEALDGALAKATVCAMVKRSMVGGVDLAGVSQRQEAAGPFSQGVSYSNPLGDLYLTRQERRRLGYGGVRAGNVGLASDSIFEA